MQKWAAPYNAVFRSYGGVTIAGERLQILTFVQHSWPLSSEGSLARHTYYDLFMLFNPTYGSVVSDAVMDRSV